MVNNVNDDGHQPAHHEDDRQAQTTPHQRLGPADAVPTTVSLTQRAPTAPIPTRTWIMKLTFQDYLALHFKHVCEQKNDCIRSQRADVEYGLSQGPNTGATEGITAESATFPYPPFYRSLMIHGEQQLRDAKELKTILGWDFGLDFIAGEISRKWEITPRDVYYKPLYLVVGLFPRGHPNPRERVVFVQHPKHLFWNLFWASFRLRGVSGTFLSLRHINGFRLYKCNAHTGLHERVDLDRNGRSDLLLLADAYKRWLVPRYVVEDWARWIHKEFNNGSHDVLDGEYSLELVLEWSAKRIAFVIFFPVLLSLAIGFWLNANDWTDLATIQTAWGTASYIVTAGGVTAALLGILSRIPG